MADVRELIMVRLLAISSGIAGVTSAVRNQSLVSDIRLPAIHVFDGDEDVDGKGVDYRKSNFPGFIILKPIIYLNYSGASTGIGTTINAARAALIKAVLDDSQLATYVGSNGKVRYEGCVTGLQPAREMVAQMVVNFSFTYPIKTSDL